MSVYGTDILQLPTELFSPADSTELGVAEASPRHHLSGLRPTGLDGQSTRPLLRRFGVPGGSTLQDGAGMSTGCPSATPLGPRLRVRLTLR